MKSVKCYAEQGKGTDILAVGESLSDAERAEWPPEGWMISDRSVQPNAVIVPLPEWRELTAQFEEAMMTICRLCKIINPHHAECDRCAEMDGHRAALDAVRPQ